MSDGTKVTRGHGIERDPAYDWIEPLLEPPQNTNIPRGMQCGQCGMKFEYGATYGYCCPNTRCPTGWGPSGR